MTNCRYCDASLDGKRADAEFCADRCRKAYERHSDEIRRQLPPDQLSEDGTIRTSYGYCERHDLRFTTNYLRVPGESPAVWHGAGGGCELCNQEAAIQRDAERTAADRLKTPEVQAELKRLAAEAVTAAEPAIAQEVDQTLADYVNAIKPQIDREVRNKFAEYLYAETENSLYDQFVREALEPQTEVSNV